MNFDFVKNVSPKTEELAVLYTELADKLDEAEDLYWTSPPRCGILLRDAAHVICRIYNAQYEIGVPEDAALADYLCYTGEREQNVIVSRFLSVVRSEQRDRLEWLRVWGDECAELVNKEYDGCDKDADGICGMGDVAEQYQDGTANTATVHHRGDIQPEDDHVYLMVKKMMINMLETVKTLCMKTDSMEGIADLAFREDVLPGYLPPDERETIVSDANKNQDMDDRTDHADKKKLFRRWREA